MSLTRAARRYTIEIKESTVNNAEVVEEESFSRLMWVLESQVSVG